jgi:alkanesulfonate monooxygenase SsuD/methylene tetrahydromethanopterin reductase-like flavin-dependent oxidoreductase (luciferase family)
VPSPTAGLSPVQPRAHALGRLGLILPTFPQRSERVPTGRDLSELSRRAEAAGAGALWACDHLYWHTPVLECMSAITAAALATKDVAVGSCVLQLPLRSAHVVAKQAASLQELSGGRIVLGVGIGTHRGEYEAAGTAFADRGARLDRSILAMREAWASAEHSGRYLQLPTPDPVPVWVGGSSEAALRRSARLGDGWIPLFLAPAEYAASLERLRKETDRCGREQDCVFPATVVFVAAGTADRPSEGLRWMSSLYGIEPSAFRRHLLSGKTSEVARSISRYYEAGARHVAVFVTSDSPADEFEDLWGEIRELGVDEA